MSPTSHVTVSPGGTITFAGADAVALYRATVLRQALRLLRAGITPRAGWTRTRVLAKLKPFTGQTYGRGDAELARAMADLNVWIANMKAALPVDHEPAREGAP